MHLEQQHDLYALMTGIDDFEKFIEMKRARYRISFRVRDYDTAIRFNNRNLKRKVSNEYIENVAQDITRRAQDFEAEFLIPFLDDFKQMLKERRP